MPFERHQRAPRHVELAHLLARGDVFRTAVLEKQGWELHRVWTPPLARNEPVLTPAVDGVQWQVARSADQGAT